jgi:hypothetical protein
VTPTAPFGTSVSPVLIVRTVPYSDPWHVLSAWSFLFGRLYKLSCNRPQALLKSGPSSYAPEISTHWSISSCGFSLGLEQTNKHTIPTFNEVKENQVLQEPLKQTLTMWLCPKMRHTNIYHPKLPGKDNILVISNPSQRKNMSQLGLSSHCLTQLPNHWNLMTCWTTYFFLYLWRYHIVCASEHQILYW